MADKREFANDYADYHGEKLIDSNGLINKDLYHKLKEHILHHLRQLQEVVSHADPGDRDYSVYTGISGIAMLFAKLGDFQEMAAPDNDYHHLAMSLLKRQLRHLKGQKFTFLCGDAGPLALGAVMYNKTGQVRERQDCVDRLNALVSEVCSCQWADEHLTGRAGVLYALLFVRHHLGDEAVKLKTIAQLFHVIIDSGRSMSVAQKWPSPLLYEWHDKKYLGAAHGLAGIFYMLMQAACVDPSLKPSIVKYVIPCLDHLMTLKFPSGNYPSSMESSSGDKLVHWCHGAPGWIYMFIQAYKLLGDDVYLEAARSCGDVIWKRGLLRKGYGLCHGVAGNGYGLLALYNLTGEFKYLHRAVKFAEWCFDYGKHGCRTPDRPYSLYEGLAGTLYYWLDLLEPHKARFPGFQL